MQLDTAGQIAEFSIANSVPLAGAQYVAWGSTGSEVFNLVDAGIKDAAVRCTCGSYSWNTNNFDAVHSGVTMLLTLPAASNAKVS